MCCASHKKPCRAAHQQRRKPSPRHQHLRPRAQAAPQERVRLGPFSDKSQRTAVHGIFKAWSSLGTETGADGCIELGLGGGKGIKRRRSEWAGGEARYVKFTLCKENMESQVGASFRVWRWVVMKGSIQVDAYGLCACHMRLPALVKMGQSPPMPAAQGVAVALIPMQPEPSSPLRPAPAGGAFLVVQQVARVVQGVWDRGD